MEMEPTKVSSGSISCLVSLRYRSHILHYYTQWLKPFRPLIAISPYLYPPSTGFAPPPPVPIAAPGSLSCVRSISSIGCHIATVDLNLIHAAERSTANSCSTVYIFNIPGVASISALGINSSVVDDNGTDAAPLNRRQYLLPSRCHKL